MFLAIEDVANKAPIDNTNPDWRQAAVDLVNFWIGQGRCFSSGEVAAALRIHRPDLRFSVPRIGETLRDLFWSNQMPPYADDGNGMGPASPTQIIRFCTGRFPDRTPANTEVFVYGPNQMACESHEFEIFIPKPGESMSDAPVPAVSLPASQTGMGTAMHSAGIQVYGAKIAVNQIRASALSDGRLYIPRTAFEALCCLNGTPIRQGDSVYVKADDVKVEITLTDMGNSAKPRKLVDGKGSLTLQGKLVGGSHFLCAVDKDKITIDLTAAL